ncbi:uncharacterized protein DUF3558 [Prauserella shujinwangii]|uniref:Uncharacterized protein DUF3558 n=2 Tax=Prauserella shujinwangii TaxID=1453103 RepID=A0A2T0LUZ7_9PSEU|nr:uncharacterized protein DUF3558 [Prauserella shujinwangii]
MCAYKYASDASSQIHVILDTNLSNGLSDIYARESGLAYFEPTTVSDYPAVYAGSTDDRANGVCELHIGVTDSVAVTLIAYLSPGTSDYPRGCEVAELTAKTMIENLKGGS